MASPSGGYLVQLLSEREAVDSCAGDATAVHHVSRIEHIAPVVRDATMFLVQTDVHNVSANLVDELQKTGKAFGIVPEGRTRSEEKLGAMQVVSFDGGTKKSSVLADTIRSQLEGRGWQYHQLTNAKDATKILGIPQPINLIGIVTDGRQTYCGLGENLCLHPEIEDLDRGVAGPASIGAHHWFIQSCHSPFMWSDFGTYRTVPIGIMMENPCAKTVICSKRVQIRVPGIVDLYIALCLEGHPLGEVVIRLNEHVEYRRFDTAPFFLLGDPSCRATPANFNGNALEIEHLAARFSHERKLQLFLHRALSNLSNLANTKNRLFGDGNRAGNKEQGRAWKASQDFPAQQAREEIRLCGVVQPSLEALWNSYYEKGGRSLRLLSADVARLFLQTDGYYYRIGPVVSSRHYVTLEIEPLEGGRYRRKELNVSSGVHPLDEYRIRIHTDRDLATMDVAAHLESGFRCRRTGTNIEFSYTNMSDDLRWVFGCVFCSDPNNVSKHKSGDVFWELMSKVKIGVADATPAKAKACRDRNQHDNSAWIFDGEELSKGKTYTMSVHLDLGEDGIFYALVEAFIFVDFCWNWLSFTYRSTGIEEWMSTNDYRRSIGLVPR